MHIGPKSDPWFEMDDQSVGLIILMLALSALSGIAIVLHAPDKTNAASETQARDAGQAQGGVHVPTQ
jgi:hypothetical protein